ncbi:MAG TPA: hypothetical protein VF278_01605 [Pirellulales bacterium]
MTARTRYRNNLRRLIFFGPASAAAGGGRWPEKEGRGHHKMPFLAVNQRSTGVKPAVAERNKPHTEPLLAPRVK